MYLTEFKKRAPELGMWQDLCNRTEEALHSWKEAHAIMNAPARGTSIPCHAKFCAMRRLVYKLAGEAVCNTETSWPIEAITFHIITNWRSHHD